MVEVVHTFDFENLFTNIPHANLLNICEKLYEDYLFNEDISKNDWLDLCNFNIFENYLFNGQNFYKQKNGIPMGKSFSSAFANIFLHIYEVEFIKNNCIKGFRYIDDLIIFDHADFDFLRDLYPVELVLKKTNSNEKIAHYLDLDILILDNNVRIGVYDKRLDFEFEVICLSNFNSNLNGRIFYNIFYSQLNRIKEICNNSDDFDKACKILKHNLKINDFPSRFCGFMVS